MKLGRSASCAGLLLLSGCLQVLGLDEYQESAAGGKGGSTTIASSSSVSTSSSSTTSASTSVSASSSASGTGGAPECTGSETADCYDGVPATSQDHPPCQKGTQTCDGTGHFGPCLGQVLPSVELCSAVTDENCDGSDCIEWSHLQGDATDQGGSAVASDASGNAYFGGFFTGTLPVPGKADLVSSGGNDGFLIKYDAAGTVQWALRFGVTSDQYVTDLAVDADNNVIMVGNFTGAVKFGTNTYTATGTPYWGFVAKLDPNGTVLWSDAYPTGAIAPIAVGIDPSPIAQGGGTISIVGSSVVAPATDSNVFLRNYSAVGAATLTKFYGDTLKQTAEDVAIDSSGDILIIGEFAGSLNFGTAATSSMTSAGALDVFVVKLDPLGGLAWSKRLGDTAQQYGNAIATNSSGDVVVGGAFYGTIDFGGGAKTSAGDADVFVAKFSAAGTYQWGNRFGDTALQSLRSLAVDKDKDILATGWIQGSTSFGGLSFTSAGGDDLFLFKMAQDGTHIWSKVVGDTAKQYGQAVAATPSGEWVLAAWMQGTFDLGQGATTSQGAYDALVAHFGR